MCGCSWRTLASVIPAVPDARAPSSPCRRAGAGVDALRPRVLQTNFPDDVLALVLDVRRCRAGDAARSDRHRALRAHLDRRKGELASTAASGHRARPARLQAFRDAAAARAREEGLGGAKAVEEAKRAAKAEKRVAEAKAREEGGARERGGGEAQVAQAIRDVPRSRRSARQGARRARRRCPRGWRAPSRRRSAGGASSPREAASRAGEAARDLPGEGAPRAKLKSDAPAEERLVAAAGGARCSRTRAFRTTCRVRGQRQDSVAKRDRDQCVCVI